MQDQSLVPKALPLLDRRRFLAQPMLGLSAISLSALLQRDRLLGGPPTTDSDAQGRLERPHFAPKAKRVIVVFCAGACSQLETWDYKPELQRRDGMSFDDKPAVTFQGPSGNLARPQYNFRPRGECGKMVSDLVPHLGSLVDEFAFVHSLTSKSNTHGPAENFLSTGFVLDGFPSMGAWLSYALGSESENLPAFVAIPDPRGVPQASINNWGPGFLPAIYQGTPFSSTRPIENLVAEGIPANKNRDATDYLNLLNRLHAERNALDDRLAARIASYELAGRMQVSVPETTNLDDEPAYVLKEYGADSSDANQAAFAKNCLLARRLVERGVRCVQLFNGAYASGGKLNWDGHQQLREQYDVHGPIMDRPVAAMIRDLGRRGLLQDTLVVWCTEFGRMPMFQKGAQGRDHNPQGFTAFLAGAGVKKATSYGATDELGFRAVENVLSVHDLHATILHLMGLDHERLTYRHNGFERRLTDVHGQVITPILA